MSTKKGDTREGEGTRGALVAAAALGGLSGARSLAGPAALALTRGPRSEIDGALGHPAIAATVLALAGGEMMADKHPRLPARTRPAALAGRMMLGGFAGAGASAHRGGRPVPGALVGATAALLAACVTRLARAGLTRLLRGRPAAAGAIEDVLVIAGGALARRYLEADDRAGEGTR